INNIQLLVELKRINEFENYDITDIRERREELKKNYLLSFTKEIKLYEDIYDQKILKNFNEQMFENIIEIKRNNSYQMTGLRKIDRIKLDMRDIFNYIVFNGLVYNDSIQHEIYKNYITILFESYIKTLYDYNGKSNRISEFDYFDIYIMLNMDSKILDKLLVEYNIKELYINEKTKKKFMKLFENYFKFNNKESKISNEIIKNIMNIIWRIKFSDKDYKKILNKINLDIVYDCEVLILNYSKFLYMSKKNVAKHKIIDNIYNMFKIYKKIKKEYIYDGKEISVAIQQLIILYKENNYSKLRKNSKLYRLLDREYKECHFEKMELLGIFSNNIRWDYIKSISEYLLINFDANIYSILVSYEYLEESKFKFYKYKLENILIDKIIKSRGCSSDLYFAILMLTLENKISVESKKKIKKMLLDKKTFFKNGIMNNCTYNLWKYIIFDDYPVENITLEDMYSLDEELILRLLYLCEKREGFIKRVLELIENKKNYKDLSNAYLRYTIFNSKEKKL
uniref:hypothetical protein n=1 Tax=Oceanivirga salmonicida TaxID=1769291 RepID=UPI0018D2260C